MLSISLSHTHCRLSVQRSLLVTNLFNSSVGFAKAKVTIQPGNKDAVSRRADGMGLRHFQTRLASQQSSPQNAMAAAEPIDREKVYGSLQNENPRQNLNGEVSGCMIGLTFSGVVNS